MESKICRICLDRTATISLFEKLNEEEEYREKITKCVGVSIEEGDGLPDAICGGCAAELQLCHEFVLKCRASDRALRCLDLLAAAAPLEPPIKAEVKLETPQEINESKYNDYYHDYDNFSDHKAELEEPLVNNEVTSSKKNKIQEICKILPNHLRKIKHRVYSGPIQCMTCGKVLKCFSAFKVHQLTHTKEKPFTCDLCDNHFRTKSSLKRHIYKHYSLDEFGNQRLLPDCDGRKKGKSPTLCVVCGLKLRCPSALEAHMRKHTGDRPFICPHCNKSYTLSLSLKRHIETNHNEDSSLKFVCEHCGKNFRSKNNIIIHLRTHTGERPYHCPFCEDRFAQISSLIRHKRGHTGEKPYTCETCGKAFRERCLVIKHQAVHSEARDFVCHICSKSFKTKQTLRFHVDIHNNPGKYVCNHCGSAFSVKANLNNHIERMHSEKSGICTICEKMYPDLQIHMRIHNGEKPFSCKLCNQGFATQRGMSHHIGFKHRDSAKFKCTTGQCNKAFPTISMLEFHVLKAHLADTPYVCVHCARGYLRPCDLSRHLRVSHADNTIIKSQFIKTVQISDPV